MASAVDTEWGFGLGLGTRWTNGFIDTVGGSSCYDSPGTSQPWSLLGQDLKPNRKSKWQREKKIVCAVFSLSSCCVLDTI